MEDTLETIFTDKGQYRVHTDCYNEIRKQAQKERDLEIKDSVVRVLKKYKKFNKKENILYNGNQQIDELLLIFNDERFYEKQLKEN